MKQKLFALLFKAALVLGLLLLAGSIWYYTLGRKPKLVVSAKIAAKSGLPASHLIAPGEVLLLVGTKATLYDIAAGACLIHEVGGEMEWLSSGAAWSAGEMARNGMWANGPRRAPRTVQRGSGCA